MNPEYLYAARDTNTGKLVSDITNPGRKFWQTKGAAQNAINSYYNRDYKRYNLELVVFQLLEIKEQM